MPDTVSLPHATPYKLRPDDVFFPAMAVLLLGVVLFGFAQSYFLAGMFRAPLPNRLVHVHGALFVGWIFLLVAQNILVATRNTRWHMRLGFLGVILPAPMLVLGMLTLFDSIRRNGTGIPAEIILVGDSEELLLFVLLTAWGLLARRSADTHKRLMILGTMAMTGPAIDRWPWPDSMPLGTIVVYLLLPLFIVAYDLWSRRRVHRSTAIAYALMAALFLTLLPVAKMPLWRQCVAWIRLG
jgi:hypothetical protein